MASRDNLVYIINVAYFHGNDNRNLSKESLFLFFNFSLTIESQVFI